MKQISQKCLSIILMVFAALASACHAGNSRETTCRFEYTVAVRENLIIPELKKNFAAAYVYFDYEKPVITAKDDRVVVQLSATKTLNGRELAFEDLFFVEIDPCGKRVLQSYTSQEYHKE